MRQRVGSVGEATRHHGVHLEQVFVLAGEALAALTSQLQHDQAEAPRRESVGFEEKLGQDTDERVVGADGANRFC